MVNTKEIDVNLLRNLLRYDAASGKLFWLDRHHDMFPAGKSAANPWNARYAGTEAFTATNSNGYRHGDIFSKTYQAHRVIWAIVHGKWPENQIDHINGIYSDNRIANLRVVSNLENGRNQKRKNNNKSGVTGVCFSSGKWQAYIRVNGRQKHLGFFENRKDAEIARASAEKENNFHPNHGRAA